MQYASPAASPTAASSSPTTPPSYSDVEGFLLAVLKWLQDAAARLTCTAQTNKLNTTLDLLVAVDARRRGAASTWAGVGSSSSASRHLTDPLHEGISSMNKDVGTVEAALLSMQLSVARSFLILGFVWYGISRLLAWSLPGLRVRRRASRLHRWLRQSEAAIERDAARTRATGNLRRRTNAHQLVAAAVCTGVAACCIVLLLTAHVWTGLVLWQLWESVTGPMALAWSWAASQWPELGAPVDAVNRGWLSPLFSIMDTQALHAVVHSVPNFLWQLTRQLQLMYVWHLLGSTVLGLSLWLLAYAHQRMRTFDAGLAFVTSRSGEPQMLHRLREGEERRRHRVALLLQQATLRQAQLLVERAGLQREEEMESVGLRIAHQLGTETASSLQQLEEGEAAAAAAAGDDGVESQGDTAAAASSSSAVADVARDKVVEVEDEATPVAAPNSAGQSASATESLARRKDSGVATFVDRGAAHVEEEGSAAGM